MPGLSSNLHLDCYGSKIDAVGWGWFLTFGFGKERKVMFVLVNLSRVWAFLLIWPCGWVLPKLIFLKGG